MRTRLGDFIYFTIMLWLLLTCIFAFMPAEAQGANVFILNELTRSDIGDSLDAARIEWAADIAALGFNPDDTYTVSPAGADYTTVKAALDDNEEPCLVLVFPGTYTDDTIEFTNDSQFVVGMGADPIRDRY